jgi:hypothetical protein
VYDENTGLIYLGGGQYYDPVTGRMLTRGAGQSNPYKPGAFDPAGMMVAPFALLGLIFGRKKTRTKFDQFIILFVIVLSIGLSVMIFGGSFTVQAKPVNSYAGLIIPTPVPGVPPTTTPTSTPAILLPPTSQNISIYFATTLQTNNGSAAAPANLPAPKCAVTPPYPSGYHRWHAAIALPAIYWNGMTRSQLGAYQKDQNPRNDCAIYAIAASLNLLGNTNKYDGHTLALAVDTAWSTNKKHKELRFEPNGATFPQHQRAIIKWLNIRDNLNYSTDYGFENKLLMRSVLNDSSRLQLVTLYYSGLDKPWFYQSDTTGTGTLIEVSTGEYTFKNGANIKLPINGHTMVLVAYDPGNVYKNQVYEWGFINSWNVGREIWWLRDRDVKSLWLTIVEIKK